MLRINGIDILSLGYSMWLLIGVLVAVIVAGFFARIILKKLARHYRNKKRFWLSAFCTKVFWPTTCAIVFTLICNIIIHNILSKQAFIKWASTIITLNKVAIVIFILWFAMSWKNYARHLLQRQADITASQRAAIHAMNKVLTMIIVFIALVTLLNILSIKMTALLAVGGIGAAAVGFASKDIVANFFGGFMLHVTSPFKVGDVIACANKELTGTVENIGWYLTVLRNFDKKPIYVPNAHFSGSFVINSSRLHNRRIFLTVGLRYQDMPKVDAVTIAIRDMLAAHPEIDQTTPGYVNLTAYDASSVSISVATYTHGIPMDQFRNIQHDIMLKIAQIVDAHDASFAFPTVTLDMPEPISNLPTAPRE